MNQIECKLIFIKVKPATIWDRGIVPRLHEQFMVKYAKKIGDTPKGKAKLLGNALFSERPASYCWVVEINEEVVGLCFFHF